MRKKKWRQQELYSSKYAQHLPWNKAIWITKEGDHLEIKGVQYVVTKVKLLPIPGSLPEIFVEQL